jgi:fatty-acyl-CoA synthase
MADFMSRVRQTLSRSPVLFESVEVLYRAGLVRPGRPDEAVQAMLAMRRYGPFAGSVRISARRDPHAIGLVDEIGALTFSQLDRRSNALVRAWRSHGIGSGDVVGLLCRNHRGFLDTVIACAKLGAEVVLLNTGFGARQLAQVGNREKISVLVYDQEFSPLAAGAPAAVARYLGWVDMASAADVPTLERLIADHDDSDVPAPRAPGQWVLLTSGTTGTPKGAQRQVRSPLGAAEFLDRVPYRGDEATVIAAPLFHGTGLSQLIMMLALGSTTVLARRFDPAGTLARIAHYRCTGLVAIPTMLQRILDLGEPVLAKYDTSSLRIILCAGSALSPELGNRATRAFGNVLYNLYGSTEVSVATVATPADWRRAPGTVGRPPVGCKVRLYDTDNQLVRKPYQRGRIFVGSVLTVGDLTGDDADVPDGHAAVASHRAGTSRDAGVGVGAGRGGGTGAGGSAGRGAEAGGGRGASPGPGDSGLVSTGDVGHFDSNGLLFIDGRADDMIISGGENVYPGEVENLLVEHPYINDAAVVGVPDRDFGQRLKAYVVMERGAWLPPQDIQLFVRNHLARFKVPREIAYVPDLPRNATGKLLRHLLR